MAPDNFSEKITARPVIEFLRALPEPEEVKDRPDKQREWLTSEKHVRAWLTPNLPRRNDQIIEQMNSLVRAIPRWCEKMDDTGMDAGNLVLLAEVLQVPVERLVGRPCAKATDTGGTLSVEQWAKAVLEGCRGLSCYVFFVDEQDLAAWRQEARSVENDEIERGSAAAALAARKRVEIASAWARTVTMFGASNKMMVEHGFGDETSLLKLINVRLGWIANVECQECGTAGCRHVKALSDFGRQDIFTKIFDAVRDGHGSQRCTRLPAIHPSDSRACSLTVSFDEVPGIAPRTRGWLVVYHWGPQLSPHDMQKLYQMVAPGAER